MKTVSFVLLVFAFVCFALSAIGVAREYPRINLVAAGLAFWAASELAGQYMGKPQ